MTEPSPPVPAECSMAGNDWFPLHFDRLRKSKWWRRASDLARARNVMLWGEAYKQVPAGSLPDDDDELAEAAGFGMDVETFLAHKAEIMAPWTLCSDGRWYHPTVCEVVLEAWEKASERKRAAAAKKAAQRAKARGQDPASDNVPPQTTDVPLDNLNVPGDTAEKGGDIATQDKTRQDSKEPPLPPKGNDGLFGLELDEPDAPDEVQVAFDLWNDTARRCGLPVAKFLDENRRKPIRKRLEAGGLDLWREALAAIEVSAFCRGLRPGSDGRIWRIDLTTLCQAKTYQKLVDGSYGQDAEPPKPATPPKPPEDPWRSRVREYAGRNRYWNTYDWGPAPGREGCKAPPEIQREFGIEPARPAAVRAAS